jgi:hypothetical protein
MHRVARWLAVAIVAVVGCEGPRPLSETGEVILADPAPNAERQGTDNRVAEEAREPFREELQADMSPSASPRVSSEPLPDCNCGPSDLMCAMRCAAATPADREYLRRKNRAAGEK